MAIGVNWAEVWAPVWKAVWTQDAPTPPTPTPVDATQTPAGRSRRRFYVEIDGQQFPVDSAQEATQLLDRARAIAERQSEERSERATKLLRRKKVVPKVRIAAPEITVSAALREAVAPIIADITRLYRKAEIEAELRLLLMRQMAEEEDEEEVLLLL